MPTGFKIQVPAMTLGAGLPLSPVRARAAEHATALLLDMPVMDWLGNPRALRQITDHIGNTHEIEFATRQLFFALVADRMTYRDYRERMASNRASVSEETQTAANYFHHVFTKSPELQAMGLGNGTMLLARMNFYIAQQIKVDSAEEAPNLR